MSLIHFLLETRGFSFSRNVVVRSWLAIVLLALTGCGSSAEPSPGQSSAAAPAAPSKSRDPLSTLKARPASKVAMTPSLRAAMITARQAEADERFNVFDARSSIGADARTRFRIQNRTHGFGAGFGAHGATLTPDDSAYRGELEAAAYGCTSKLTTAAGATVEADGKIHNRVELRRSTGFSEWYVNGPLGLEQGFTISRQTPCTARDGSEHLLVQVRVGGDLTPVTSGTGSDIALVDSKGQPRLSYSELYAEDAKGRALPASLGVRDGRILIDVDDTDATYPVTIDPLIAVQQAEFLPLNTGLGEFGWSVDIDAGTAVIGAPWQHDRGNYSGAAYVFIRNAQGTWIRQGKLIPDDGAPNKYFGWSVAVSVDRCVVTAAADKGGTGPGAAYVFVRTSGNWSQQTKLTGGDTVAGDWFGYSADMDVNTVIVGAYAKGGYTGAAYVFVWNGTSWVQQQKLQALDAGGSKNFAMAVSVWGDWALIGSPLDDPGGCCDQGSAYFFQRSPASGLWTQMLKQTDPTGKVNYDYFGNAVALGPSSTGPRAIIGAPNKDIGTLTDSGAVYLFHLLGTPGTWNYRAQMTAGDGVAGDLFGSSVAIKRDTAVVGAYLRDDKGSNSGAAYQFSWNGTIWSQSAKFTASDGAANDHLGAGSSVALDDLQSLVMLGGPDHTSLRGTQSGEVYAFKSGNEEARLLPDDGESYDYFGYGCDVDADTAAFGSPNDADRGPSSGSVWVYTRSGTTWTHQQKLVASDAASSDQFGNAVALQKDTLAVAAPSTKFNGHPSAGAIYVFQRTNGFWNEQAKIGASDAVDYQDMGYLTGVAISNVGTRILAGAPYRSDGAISNRGAAYIFDYDAAAAKWNQTAKLLASDGKPDDNLGFSVGLDGNVAALSAFNRNSGTGAVYVFEYSGGTWVQTAILTSSDGYAGQTFGYAVAVSGLKIVAGAYADNNVTGAAYVFEKISGTWREVQKLKASDGQQGDYLGTGVAMDGNIAVIGAIYKKSGTGYIWQRQSDGTWQEQSQFAGNDLINGEDFTYPQIGVSGDTIVSGAFLHTHFGPSSGGGYAFVLRGSNGDSCPGTFPCASGNCVDGVCCNIPCGNGVQTDCMSCAVDTASMGQCRAEQPTHSCRSAVDDCDVAEFCDGQVTVCPTDRVATNGSQCTSDNNPCTVDQCNGVSTACQHPAGNGGVVCRLANGVCDVDDKCTGTTTTCPADAYAPATLVCRGSAGECDLTENCTGNGPNCPTDTKKTSGTGCTADTNPCTLDQCNGVADLCQHPAGNSGAVCRGSTGECDLDDKCTGASINCPADAKVASGTACTADTNPCTLDQCDGSAATCQHPAGNANTVCRAALDECDLDEKCSGSSTSCPADGKKTNGTACTADTNPCTLDQCDGSSVSCQHPAGNANTVCRAQNGLCDVAEKCDGTSTSCPLDGYAATTVTCRSAVDVCDVAEKCPGTGPSCPTDSFVLSGTQCRAPSCDVATNIATLKGLCTGSAASCPAVQTQDCTPNTCSGTSCGGGCTTDSQCTAGNYCSAGVCNPKKGNGVVCGATNECITGNCVDGVCCDTACGGGVANDCQACNVGANTGTCSAAPNTIVCRSAAGECDVDDKCTGSSTTCPTDTKKTSGTACTTDSNPCTLDQCDGSSVSCQHPAGNSGTVCRAASGVCDVDETCTGTSTTCPADKFELATVVCRSAVGECDVDETCTGTGANCPSDTLKSSGTACTTDSNPCTVDQCNGSSATCQHPAGNANTVCRSAADVCDVDEKCTGTTTTCPTDGFKSNSTVCRSATAECDLDEKCSGSSAGCPSDVFKTSGTACTDDSNVCTTDKCNGTSATCQHAAGNSGTVCRAAAGECDTAETCSGTSTSCPSDALVASGTACTTDSNPCTVDQCNGSSATCQHPAGNAGTVCRTAAGECDLAETCSGTATSCPSDALKSSGTACTDDTNPCTLDQCNGTATSCQHPSGNSGTVCRAASGPCDVDEKCSGTSTTCPTDVLATSGTVCRAAADVCDVDEKCSGTSTGCPADAFQPSSIECRAASCDISTNTATLQAKCTGSGTACPALQSVSCGANVCVGTSCSGGCTLDSDCSAGNFCNAGACVPKLTNGGTCSGDNWCTNAHCIDGVCCNTACGNGVATDCQACNVQNSVGTCSPAPNTVVCRAASGECDVDEKCSGSSTTCPTDAKKASGSACTADSNPCTLDQCDGSAVTCQHPAGNSGTVCRAANGACDVDEKCSGTSTTCPADGFATSTTVCRAALGECDQAENCLGTSASCPSDTKKTSGTTCTSDGNPCTLDQCDGSATSCQHPAGNSGTVCRAAVGVCDADEKCDGIAVNCPSDSLLGSSTVCRVAAGECDVDEKCSGTSTSCPADSFKTSSTGCTSDAKPCTLDQCNGLSAVCQHPAGNANTVCRPSADECDVDEKCDGTSTSCPGDAFKVAGTACTADTNPCTTDACNGTSITCQHPAGNAGDVCRAATGECDVVETCTGTSTACPADGFQLLGAPCTADTLPCTADQCDGNGACGHPAGNTGSVCRAASGPCDVDETCDGASTSCPTDAFKPSGTACPDDGNPCTVDQCGTTGSCSHPAGNAGTVCRAATNLCDADEKCDGTTASCPTDAALPDGTTCKDDSVCNGTESCQTGACTPGTALDCDDKNPCTVDSCDNATGCANVPVTDGTNCDDGNACTSGDKCQAGQCKGTGDTTCADDNNPCTVTTCNTATQKCTTTNVADGTTCSDNDVCTQVDTCQGGTCVGSQPMNCDDGNPCTVANCDPAIGCDNKPAADGASCADGNKCNGDETCQKGVCAKGTVLNCNDSDPCTADTCSSSTGCRNIKLSDGASCSDGNVCNGNETCQAGACKRGPALSCNDNNPCTVDSCDATTGGCLNVPVADGTGCADNDVCNGTETCQQGACTAGVQPNCDDADDCTSDQCDPAVGCIHVAANNGTPCNDDDVCTTGDKCQSGACMPSGTVPCDDGNPCTDDTCDGDVGCRHSPKTNGTTCDDGNPCSTGDQCNNGVCKATGGVVCPDDGNPCTIETCDTTTQTCKAPTAAPDGTPCDDGDYCTVGDTCRAGTCTRGTALDCTDANICTVDECTQSAGCVRSPNDGTPCSDGNPCTDGEQCLGTKCAPGTPAVCVALNECHDIGSCDSSTGVCSGPTKADGTTCLGTGTCRTGECITPTSGGGAGGATGTGGNAGSTGTGANGGSGQGGNAGTGTGGNGGTGNLAGTSSGGQGGGNLDGGVDAGTFSFKVQGCSCRSVGSNSGGGLAGLGVILGLVGLSRRRRRDRGAAAPR